MVLKGVDKMAKNGQNVGLNQDSNQGPSRDQKKWEFFVYSSTTELLKLSTKKSRINTKWFQNYLST